MPRAVLKVAVVLTVCFGSSLILIRAQSYHDRTRPAVIQEDCPAPCFMGIRPDYTSMRRAVSIIESHDWIAPGVGFPSQVRNAVFYDAAVPRIRIQWRWSDTLPSWVNMTEPGQLTFEDREVRDLTINTNLALGEIFLAFGNPNRMQFTTSNGSPAQRFDYGAWYAEDGMFITAEGTCSIWNYYHASVHIAFRINSPQLSETDSQRLRCS
jgi:hypothetical protein